MSAALRLAAGDTSATSDAVMAIGTLLMATVADTSATSDAISIAYTIGLAAAKVSETMRITGLTT